MTKRSKHWLGRAIAAYETANDAPLQAIRNYEMTKAQAAALIAIAYELVVEEEEDVPIEPELKTEYKDPLWDKVIRDGSGKSDESK